MAKDQQIEAKIQTPDDVDYKPANASKITYTYIYIYDMYKYELYTPNFLRRGCPGGAEDNGPMCTPKANGESCVSRLPMMKVDLKIDIVRVGCCTGYLQTHGGRAVVISIYIHLYPFISICIHLYPFITCYNTLITSKKQPEVASTKPPTSRADTRRRQ
jgi:hypothetical protein